MGQAAAGVSVPSRNVFDALLEWNEAYQKEHGEVEGLIEYITSVEGVLLDLNDQPFFDSVSPVLWYWLNLVTESDHPKVRETSRRSLGQVLRGLLHTALLHLLESRSEAIIPASRHRETDELRELARRVERKSVRVTELRGHVERLESQRRTALNEMEYLQQWWDEHSEALQASKDDEPHENEVRYRSARKRLTDLNEDLAECRTDLDREQMELGLTDEAELDTLRRRLQSINQDPSVIWPSDDDVRNLKEAILFSKNHAESLTTSLLEGQFSHVLAKTRDSIRPFAVWTVTLRFLSRSTDGAAFGSLIWVFCESLSSIPGVRVYVEEAGTGSVWVKMKVWMQNVWARDDVKEVLEKSKDAVIASKLDRPIGEVDKINAEADKLRAESEQLAVKTESMQEDRLLERESKELDNEKKRLDNEKQAIENRMAKLQLYKEASTMIRDGIIRADPVQIDVNDLMYMLIEGGTATEGNDIGRIEEAGSGDNA